MTPASVIRRSSLKRWLTFGPMRLTRRPLVHARLNRMQFRVGKLRGAGGIPGLRVTRYGGPAAPGLFRHKAYSVGGGLLVTRRGRGIIVGKKPRTARQRAQSRINGRRGGGRRHHGKKR